MTLLRGKRIVCLLSTSLLFTYPTNVQAPFHSLAEQSIEKQIDVEMVQDFKLKSFEIQFEKDKLELEKKESKEQKTNELKNVKEDDNIEWQEFIVTFYTGLEEENSIHGNVDCKGRPLERGVIANNILPLGTKIFLEKDYGTRIVSDKGGSNFNSSNQIDMYVERWDGETREQWKKRANSYGVKKLRGYIVK